MDTIDRNWNKPFSALAGHDRVIPEGVEDTIYGAYVETDIGQPGDSIVFGVDYDLAFDVAQDNLHDSLYLGEVIRNAAGDRVELRTTDGETIAFDERGSYDSVEEVPLDMDRICDLMCDYLRGLLSQDRYQIPQELIDGLYVEHIVPDASRIDISIGIPSDHPGTVGEVFESIAWPFYGGIANGTDPGTFNHSYWASEAARMIEKSATA